MAAWPRNLWNNWSIQLVLVLLSLGLQLALFLFAGIRRRGAHRVLRFLLWLAYRLADYTATYALGHLSLKGAPREHPIVAFWAPFLLLHLGGPDNITAYSLEDNKLWKRHLLHAVLQVLAAVYVLYEHISARGALLRLAFILMFAVGAVKYGEKTWALMWGNLDSIRGSVKKQPPAMHRHFHPHDEVFKDGVLDEESLVRRAHSLFHICKRAIVDCPVIEDDSHGHDTTRMVARVKFCRLMETELSLMYDMLYTKAPVIHTWFGFTVRLISPLAIVGSLLLFKLIGKDGHRGVDVVITYALYGGALFMETTSLLNALGSSWTFAFLSTTRCRWLRYAALCNERWDRLRRLVAYLHHLVRVGGGSRYRSRRWSRTMGQYNMLHFCTRSDVGNGLFTRPLLSKFAKMVGLGLNEWWNMERYSWTIEMPNHVKDYISRHMTKMYMEGGVNSLGMLRNRWGEEPLVREELFHGILKDSLGVEFQECIIIWHIGSDVFLAKRQRAKDEDASLDVEAIKVISNYMMFLLVEQPDMLPGLSQNRLYQRTCENLVKTRRSTTSRRQRMNLCAKPKNLFGLHDDPSSSSRVADREELAKILCDEYATKGFSHDAPRLPYVAKLAKHLLTMEEDGTVDSVKLVLDVWTDILVYASNKCSRKAHAEKLNSGGELTTILWLMAEHFYQLYLEGLIQKEKNNLPVEGTNQAGT
ncbi:hypothetical protein CFC21_090139 [Triticum aestivum]|uniref:DUF4220 domain-containing protein n=2 Tax=Triticum aestivum TaxID=4565 RepID=A0A3B6PTH3_WHEAT|nr:uncharacterized protein LOC123139680 [Triticum aestivum]KAF7086884.1 hypothetical protein CFC21_090139 [Triticum aestivum]